MARSPRRRRGRHVPSRRRPSPPARHPSAPPSRRSRPRGRRGRCRACRRGSGARRMPTAAGSGRTSAPPRVLQVRDEAGAVDDVDRAVPDDLIRDAEIPAPRVPGPRRHVSSPHWVHRTGRANACLPSRRPARSRWIPRILFLAGIRFRTGRRSVRIPLPA